MPPFAIRHSLYRVPHSSAFGLSGLSLPSGAKAPIPRPVLIGTAEALPFQATNSPLPRVPHSSVFCLSGIFSTHCPLSTTHFF